MSTRSELAEAIAWDNTFKRAINVGLDDFRMGRKSNDGLARSIADAALASDALAQMLADAEQRGADRVTAAVEAVLAEPHAGQFDLKQALRAVVAP